VAFSLSPGLSLALLNIVLGMQFTHESIDRLITSNPINLGTMMPPPSDLPVASQLPGSIVSDREHMQMLALRLRRQVLVNQATQLFAANRLPGHGATTV
jgi:hypothetical protein